MARKNEYLERCAVECANILPHYKVLEVGFAHGLGLQYAAEKSMSMNMNICSVEMSCEEAENVVLFKKSTPRQTMVAAYYFYRFEI